MPSTDGMVMRPARRCHHGQLKHWHGFTRALSGFKYWSATATRSATWTDSKFGLCVGLHGVYRRVYTA